MFKKIAGVWCGIAAGSAMMVTTASAAPLVDVSSVTLDTTSLATIGGLVIAGLASIWGFRKVVKSINRS